jgi:putative membrane-bound dehydrogenase-like protein
MSFRIIAVPAMALGCVAASLALAIGQSDEKPAAFPQVFNTQDPKDKLSTPEDALQWMHAPEGFRVSLFASEPQVQQPIAFTTDERGRIWVAENYTYAESRTNFDRTLRDRIVILEDTDGDGKADKRTVFWDKAQLLTSVEVGFGGVFALCAPHLLFIPDRDRDDIPDGEPIVLLDGWNDDSIRHNIVNGLKWGPDGWLYGRHGIQATSLVGKPGASESQRTALNCAIWRYHPTRGTFEVVCQGGTNSWGFDYDEHGQMFFINTVIGHLWHAVPGAYYRRMYGVHFNPHLYQYIEQTADHFHWDTGEAWSDIRKGVTNTTSRAGGGHAHSGLLIYQGDNWPERYRGTLFTVNLHGRRVNNDRLLRYGAGYIGRHSTDFLTAEDPWFRGIDLIQGPAGEVYIADWTDVGECHENDGVHRTSGRIYTVSYGDPQPAKRIDLSRMSDRELVGLQLHRNEWHVRQARRLLQERAAARPVKADVLEQLRVIAEQSPDVTRNLRAMWCLVTMNAVDEMWLLEQLKHSEEHVRVWAVRFLSEGELSPAVVEAFADRASSDGSGIVQLFLASAAQRLPPAARWRLVEALVARRGFYNDSSLPLMLWYAVEPVVPHDIDRAVRLVAAGRVPLVRQFAARRITAEIERHPQGVEGLIGVMTEATRPTVRRDVLRGMRDALRGWQKAPVPKNWQAFVASRAAAAGDDDEEEKELIRELSVVFGDGRAMQELLRVVTDGKADPEFRRQSLRTLVANRAPDFATTLQRLLDDRALVGDAARGLAAYDHPATPKLLLDRYPRLSPEVRSEAVATLVSRREYAAALLDAVAAGIVPRLDLSAFQARQIRDFDDGALTEKLAKVWGETRATDAEKQTQIARYKSALSDEVLAQADLSAGRAAFNSLCATCHVLYGQGKAIGPDLTGSNRRNLDYLLENIVDPSASVAADFRMSALLLKSGRVVTGVVLEQTDRTLAVQTPTERLTLDRNEIEEVRPTRASLMPDALLDNLTDAQRRDLTAYLMSAEQAPLPQAAGGSGR